MGLSVGSYARVNGKEILDKPNDLFSRPGLPPDVRALVHESLLLDTESAGVMAQLALGRTATRDTLALAQKRMKSAVRGLWLARDQKTVLARKPKLVVADEPTANLDRATGEAILRLMRHMQEQYRISFLFASHDTALMKAADDLIVLRDGVIQSTKRKPAAPDAAASLPAETANEHD